MTARKIETELRAAGDPEKARFLQRFFKTGPGEYAEGDVFLGIKVPQTRKLARTHRTLDLSEVELLLGSRYHEARLLALFILVEQFARGDDAVRARIYKLYRRCLRFVNNWDLVDGSAHKIVGPYLAGRSRKPLYDLARSPNVWRRRMAIMSTLHFIHADDFDDTLALATLLIDDEHDLIHKATGWMLREVGKRDAATARAFLDLHAADMPRTMLRYAIERYPPRVRARYMKLGRD